MCFSFLVTWPPRGRKPAPHGPWLSMPAGRQRAPGGEGGRDKGRWCPALPGWPVSGRPVGLFLPPVSPFLFLPSGPGASQGRLCPLEPSPLPKLLCAGETRDSEGKG